MVKKILVTGGNGLIGNGIKSAVQTAKLDDEEWIFVGSKDADLTDYSSARLLFEKYKPTHVIHLAAKVGGLYCNMKNNLEFFRKNMQMNDNVLNLSHEFNVEKVVSCLSTCIFPNKITYPIDESMIHNGPPYELNYGYSYAKRFITVLNQGYFEKYGRKYTAAIPCNTYGPHDNFVLVDGHVVPGLINRLYDTMYIQNPEKPSEEKEFLVLGTGKALRQFLYSLDMGKLFIWMMRTYDKIDPLIFCSDIEDEITVGEVAKLIAKAFNFKGKIVFDTTQSDGQIKKTVTNSKLRSYLSDFKFTTLEDGIQQTVDWYIKNYEVARK